MVVLVCALAAWFIFNPSDAIGLIIPDLNKISNINAVIRKDSAYTHIRMVFENKNPYSLNIDSLDFNIRLNDTSIASEKIALNLSQSRFSVDTAELPLNLSIKHIRKIISHLQQQDSTTARASGTIVYQTFFGRTRLNFDKKANISVPVPPEIKVVKVERKKLDRKTKILKANAIIHIVNNSKKLNLNLKNVHYRLSVKNTLYSEGTIAKSVEIVPGSSIVLHVPIDIKVYHPLKTLVIINLDRDRLNYDLELNFNVTEHISEKAFNSFAEIRASGELELVK